MTSVEEAIIAKMTWKTDESKRYARALLETGVSLFLRGTGHFNNDDVKPEFQPLDKTTVGAVVKLLVMAGVIEFAPVHLPEKGVRHGYRKSTRPECNGHRNPVYRLTNTGIALEWLKRNGSVPLPRQGELFALEGAAT